MGLVSELRRRNVLRMAVLYVVAAWLVMQVAEVLIALAKLPDWIGPTTLILLAVGFPIAVIVSWFYEITPEGISLEKDVEPGESITHVIGRRLDFLVISLLCAAVILFAYDKWWTGPPPEKSIAVLAFENMSGDPEQEYFSDGISEELLNLLAQIPELTVISRSSSFSFKGKGIAIPAVAAQLNVAHVLEGSVRKMGNRVRITAQLIEASSDKHLWSETYDRTLEDIFVIQDEIAAAVVDALKLTLLGDAPQSEPTNLEAYTRYLQAEHVGARYTEDALEQSNALLKQALTTAPNYAKAWRLLSRNYLVQAGLGALPREEGNALAKEAINQALAIDPDLAEAHSWLGLLVARQEDSPEAAAQHIRRGLSLEPHNRKVLGHSALFLTMLGRLDRAITIQEYIVARDPMNRLGRNNLGYWYLIAGRWDEAIATARTWLILSPDVPFAHSLLGLALLGKGENEAALKAIQQEPDEALRLRSLVMAYHASGQVVESDAVLSELIEKYGQRRPSEIAWVLAYCSEVDRAFVWLERAVTHGDPNLLYIAAGNRFTNLYEDPRWLPFLNRIGWSPSQLDAIEFEVMLPN
jgi:adenylate cyclase